MEVQEVVMEVQEESFKEVNVTQKKRKLSEVYLDTKQTTYNFYKNSFSLMIFCSTFESQK